MSDLALENTTRPTSSTAPRCTTSRTPARLRQAIEASCDQDVDDVLGWIQD
ncbi:hypothetical protein [Streptomyces sp. NPDC057302]|uniref:hypothetical protein n=1 Tax=Streptomyces sp. NPDC057302 TaxID=3346094 RepID=UPI0036355F9A